MATAVSIMNKSNNYPHQIAPIVPAALTTSDTGCRLNCMHVCHMMEIDLHTQHGNGKWEMRAISTIT